MTRGTLVLKQNVGRLRDGRGSGSEKNEWDHSTSYFTVSEQAFTRTRNVAQAVKPAPSPFVATFRAAAGFSRASTNVETTLDTAGKTACATLLLQQPLHRIPELLLGFAVFLPAGRAWETGMHVRDAAIAAQEE